MLIRKDLPRIDNLESPDAILVCKDGTIMVHRYNFILSFTGIERDKTMANKFNDTMLYFVIYRDLKG